MAATLWCTLVFELDGARTGLLKNARRVRHIDCVAKARVRIDNQGQATTPRIAMVCSAS